MFRVEWEYEHKGQMTLHRIARAPDHLRDCREWNNPSPFGGQPSGQPLTSWSNDQSDWKGENGFVDLCPEKASAAEG